MSQKEIRTQYTPKQYLSGIYINELPEGSDSHETAKSLNNNFVALKDRLRQLGFYTDLSDASNSQVIKPRFKVEPEIAK